ncbi:mechanosensitive ion channel domain-containing protein [Puniceicoccus vermicola]|uniref:Mechanosensitive ion channel n=1 Tax=Puniceicoccus vermicola TaxID=388746 RepID=A0A7X1AY06_9BACT|nr:mechanosensitive ion channel [Puniceicoccus vermicola]
MQGILDELASHELEEDERYLLHPANTSSPRDTIVSFIKLTQRFHDLISSEDYSPEDRIEVMHLFGEIQDFFDMRNVPPSLRADYASAAGIYLREIIDRVGLPDLDHIPGEIAMRAAIAEGQPARWQIPGLPFEIARVNSGPEEGRYLFTENTLLEAKAVFQRVREMPYVSEAAKDFYYYFFLTPNPIIPAEWIDALPDWMLRDFYEQTVWQWFSMFAVILIAAFSVWLLRKVLKRISRERSALFRHLCMLIVPSSAIGVSLLGYNLIDDKIFITGEVFQVVTYLLYLVLLASGIIVTFVLGTVICDLVTRSERFEGRTFDSHLARIGIRIGSIIVCLGVLIQGLQQIGFSLATVIAGAGVTGLAVALAAQSTLRNIFGSLMILIDRPFRVGQRIIVSGHDGTVEEIGLRSTRIRLLNGHVTSIPNERMADAEIENVGLRPYIRRVSSIHLAHGMPIEKVNRAVEIIRKLLEPHEVSEGGIHASDDPNAPINYADFPPRVFFNEFNRDSLNILMIYWYHPPEYWNFLEFSQRINEEILEKFREEEIEFAFPTRTVHIAGTKATPFPQIEGEEK